MDTAYGFQLPPNAATDSSWRDLMTSMLSFLVSPWKGGADIGYLQGFTVDRSNDPIVIKKPGLWSRFVKKIVIYFKI